MAPVSGLELVEFIRTDPQLGMQNTPVIILTANPVKDNVLKARSFGVEAFLAKPVSRASPFGEDRLECPPLVSSRS
ncbi:MAG: hypothetical protein HYR63_11450 [Proteobacteria bacterium]|nr:hypothetical protein [Pseudomonadota bacterium]MBI3496331.1 hypothetical protein [Pseudomonadota bacterium]